MKQGSYTGQNWFGSQSTLSTGLLPMRKRATGSWFEPKGLYAPNSAKIPAAAWAYAALFISIALVVLFVGAKAGL
jgi:hypothetical protein